MDQERKELLINRVISGVLYFQCDGKMYKILPATAEQKYVASFKYFQYLEENTFQGLPTQHDLAMHSYNQKFWTQEHDQELDLVKTKIEAIQVDMFKNFSFSSRVDTLRKNIALERKKESTLYELKHMLTAYSKEFQADQYSHKFLLALRIRDMDDKPVYTIDTYLQSCPMIVNAALEEFFKNAISQTELRLLARTTPFRNYWSISKIAIFPNIPANWTDEQHSIAIYSKMYDNVYESSDCPPEGVINDDDILDGWFIVQNKERNKNKKQQSKAENIGAGGHSEVMIPVTSREEAKEVFYMNDQQGQMEIRQRESLIKDKGEVKEQHLPDVQMRIQREIIEQTKRK